MHRTHEDNPSNLTLDKKVSRPEVAILAFLNIVDDRTLVHPGLNLFHLFYTPRLTMGCLKINLLPSFQLLLKKISHLLQVHCYVCQKYLCTSGCLKLRYTSLSGEHVFCRCQRMRWHISRESFFSIDKLWKQLWTTVQAWVCTLNIHAFGEMNLVLNSLRQFVTLSSK